MQGIIEIHENIVITQHICMHTHSVYKESPRYYLSIEIQDQKFWKFKTHLYNHHSPKTEHITK